MKTQQIIGLAIVVLGAAVVAYGLRIYFFKEL